MIAIQCPLSEEYHIQAENLLVEVLDDQGQECADGETGRVVITDLHNFATPLIRYEIGDLAEKGGSCACGRGLPLLRRIHGRVRNMLRLRSGDKVFPDVASHRLGEIGPVRQSRLVQRSYDSIDIELVLHRPLSDDERRALLGAVGQALPVPFRLNPVIVEEIPCSAAGKFEDFICAIP